MRNLWISALLLVGLTVVGALGLMVLGGRSVFEAFYLTVVILTTVGMEGPNSDAERAWGLFLMIAGVGTVIYATGQVVSFLIEGQLRDMIGRRKVNEHIRKLESHYIVVGFGRMGQALCATLSYHDRSFVLIENCPERLAIAEERGYLVVSGDATEDMTLLHAGIDRASGLAACLPRDADNVFVALSARGLGPNLHISARCEDAATDPKLRRAGADRVICPAVIGAQRASDHLLNPQVEEMVELDGAWPDLEIAMVRLSQFPEAKCRVIGDLHTLLGERTSVIALIRADGSRILRPSETTPVHRDDQVVICGNSGSTSQVVDQLTHPKAA
ncbi:MAG: NAD-binding protein [Planctomycetota bacterium]